MHKIKIQRKHDSLKINEFKPHLKFDRDSVKVFEITDTNRPSGLNFRLTLKHHVKKDREDNGQLPNYASAMSKLLFQKHNQSPT